MENKARNTRIRTSCKNVDKQRVCRTCMSPNELHPLFPKANHYESFERALFLTTGLQIKFNDGLPQKICKKCAKMIESVMRFRSQTHCTEKKLLMYFKHKKKLELPKSKQINIDNSNDRIAETAIEIENATPKGELIFTAKRLASIKVDTEQLESNRVDSDENNGGYHACSDTDDRSPESLASSFPPPDKEDDEQASKLQTRKKPFLDLLEPRQRKDPYTCKICKRSMTTVEGFKKHSMVHLGYEVLCEFCGHEMATTLELLRHQRAKHGLARDNSFPCSFCEFKGLDKEMKESHERRVHTKERPYVCDECGEAFFTKRVLMQHGYIHKSEKPFECDSCSTKFKLRPRLIWHIKTVHMHKNKYKYSCYMCQKMYNSGTSARKHILKVHGVQKSQQGKLQRSKRDDI